MNLRSFLAGLACGVVAVGIAVAAPLTGPQDPGQLFNYFNSQLLSWMTVNANGGELQLLGPHGFVTNGSKVYLVTMDSGGTPRYILTTATSPP